MKHETNFIIIIGWMQLVILVYHFTGCSRSLEIYRLMRINVSSYLFLNGYGHFQYFWRQLQQEKIQPETTGINKFIKGLQRFLMVFYVSNKFFQPKKSPIFQKCQHSQRLRGYTFFANIITRTNNFEKPFFAFLYGNPLTSFPQESVPSFVWGKKSPFFPSPCIE